MLIKNQFDVAEPLDKVWEFFGNVPQVAACLPGAELTEDLGDETYGGWAAGAWFEDAAGLSGADLAN